MDPNQVTIDPLKAQLKVYEDLTQGVGGGTATIFAFLVLAIIVCFFKKACIFPNCCACICFMIPVLILIFLVLMPKQQLEEEVPLPTSWYFIKTVAFTALTGLLMVCSILCLLLMKI